MRTTFAKLCFDLVFGDQRLQQALALDSAGNLYAYIPATGNQADQLRKALDTSIKLEAKELPLPGRWLHVIDHVLIEDDEPRRVAL